MSENGRYVFVCRGPHCTRRSSRQLHDQLQEIVESRASAAPAPAVVSSYPCFGLCDDGPNALVYPDLIWYSDLDRWDLEAVADHVYGGVPHQRKRVEPQPDVTACTLENIREAWELSRQPKRKLRWWPFGR